MSNKHLKRSIRFPRDYADNFDTPRSELREYFEGVDQCPEFFGGGSEILQRRLASKTHINPHVLYPQFREREYWFTRGTYLSALKRRGRVRVHQFFRVPRFLHKILRHYHKRHLCFFILLEKTFIKLFALLPLLNFVLSFFASRLIQYASLISLFSDFDFEDDLEAKRSIRLSFLLRKFFDQSVLPIWCALQRFRRILKGHFRFFQMMLDKKRKYKKAAVTHFFVRTACTMFFCRLLNSTYYWRQFRRRRFRFFFSLVGNSLVHEQKLFYRRKKNSLKKSSRSQYLKKSFTKTFFKSPKKKSLRQFRKYAKTKNMQIKKSERLFSKSQNFGKTGKIKKHQKVILNGQRQFTTYVVDTSQLKEKKMIILRKKPEAKFRKKRPEKTIDDKSFKQTDLNFNRFQLDWGPERVAYKKSKNSKLDYFSVPKPKFIDDGMQWPLGPKAAAPSKPISQLTISSFASRFNKVNKFRSQYTTLLFHRYRIRNAFFVCRHKNLLKTWFFVPDMYSSRFSKLRLKRMRSFQKKKKLFLRRELFLTKKIHRKNIVDLFLKNKLRKEGVLLFLTKYGKFKPARLNFFKYQNFLFGTQTYLRYLKKIRSQNSIYAKIFRENLRFRRRLNFWINRFYPPRLFRLKNHMISYPVARKLARRLQNQFKIPYFRYKRFYNDTFPQKYFFATENNMSTFLIKMFYAKSSVAQYVKTFFQKIQIDCKIPLSHNFEAKKYLNYYLTKRTSVTKLHGSKILLSDDSRPFTLFNATLKRLRLQEKNICFKHRFFSKIRSKKFTKFFSARFFAASNINSLFFLKNLGDLVFAKKLRFFFKTGRDFLKYFCLTNYVSLKFLKFFAVKQMQGSSLELFLRFLQTRLLAVVVRLKLAETSAVARRLILHRNVFCNNVIITDLNYQVSLNSVVGLRFFFFYRRKRFFFLNSFDVFSNIKNFFFGKLATFEYFFNKKVNFFKNLFKTSKSFTSSSPFVASNTAGLLFDNLTLFGNFRYLIFSLWTLQKKSKKLIRFLDFGQLCLGKNTKDFLNRLFVSLPVLFKRLHFNWLISARHRFLMASSFQKHHEKMGTYLPLNTEVNTRIGCGVIFQTTKLCSDQFFKRHSFLKVKQPLRTIFYARNYIFYNVRSFLGRFFKKRELRAPQYCDTSQYLWKSFIYRPRFKKRLLEPFVKSFNPFFSNAAMYRKTLNFRKGDFFLERLFHKRKRTRRHLPRAAFDRERADFFACQKRSFSLPLWKFFLVKRHVFSLFYNRCSHFLPYHGLMTEKVVSSCKKSSERLFMDFFKKRVVLDFFSKYSFYLLQSLGVSSQDKTFLMRDSTTSFFYRNILFRNKTGYTRQFRNFFRKKLATLERFFVYYIRLLVKRKARQFFSLMKVFYADGNLHRQKSVCFKVRSLRKLFFKKNKSFLFKDFVYFLQDVFFKTHKFSALNYNRTTFKNFSQFFEKNFNELEKLALNGIKISNSLNKDDYLQLTPRKRFLFQKYKVFLGRSQITNRYNPRSSYYQTYNLTVSLYNLLRNDLDKI